MSEPRRSAPVPWPLALAAGAALAIAVGFALTREAPRPEAPEPAPAERAEGPPAPRAPERPRPRERARFPEAVAPGGVLELRRETLPPGEAWTVRLRLDESAAEAGLRGARVVGEDGRELALEVQLDAERGTASVALDPAWLRPGPYLVELRTAETTHFPLRRYVLEVR